MKRILITGVSGLLGSNLVCFLKETYENLKIFGTDIRMPYDDVKTKLDGFSNSLDAYNHMDFDEIYHLASIVGRTNVYRNLHMLIDSNLTLLRSIYKCWPDSFLIYTSTSEVYGWNVSDVDETYTSVEVDTSNPRHVYQLTKLLCESYIKQSFNNYLILRPYNVYGKYFSLDDQRIIPKFLISAFKDKKITIYGDGTSIRSYCHAERFWMYVNMIKDELKLRNIAINIGENFILSTFELAKIIQKLVPFDIDIIFKPIPNDDTVKHRIFKSCYYTPYGMKKETFEQSLQSVISWFKTVV